MHGNLTSQEALSLGRKVQATLTTAPVSADDRPKDRVLQLPAASLCYRYQISCHAPLLTALHATRLMCNPRLFKQFDVVRFG